MVRLVKTTLTTGFLIVTSVGTSYGSGWEVNNIWWDVIPNFRGVSIGFLVGSTARNRSPDVF